MLPEYFEFHNPVKLLCGQTALENIPYEMGRLGCKKPFLLISRTMLDGGILEMMGGRYQALIGTDIPKDSSFAVVEGLARQAREEGCDGILAIGGGSVLDTAKAVRVLLSQGCTSIRELLGSEWMSKGASVPFLMVPTTAGTGSECTGVAVVQDDQTKVKQELISDQFLPDVAVLCPGDLVEAEEATRAIARYPGTCYLRLGRGGEKRIHDHIDHFEIGRAIPIHGGSRVAIFSTGAIFEEIAGAETILAGHGVHPAVWTFPTVKPIDCETIIRCAKKFDLIVTVEEHNLSGGFGSAVAEVLAELPAHARLLRVGLHDTYSAIVGNQKYLRAQFGLDAAGIAKKTLEGLE